jgi:dienelactone hydrolase
MLMIRKARLLAIIILLPTIITIGTGCSSPANHLVTSSSITQTTTNTITTESTTTTKSTTSSETSTTRQTTTQTKSITASVSTPAQSQTTPALTTESIIWPKTNVPVSLTVNDTENNASYRSGSFNISGSIYKPSGSGSFPAVLVLHGAAGLQQSITTKAQWLATQGYITFAVDYFTPIGVVGGGWTGSSYQQYTDRICQILGDGLEALKSLPYVDSNRLGVMGFSLGGYYGTILGTRDDVKGVISYYGAFVGPPINQNPVRYKPTEIASQMKAAIIMFQGDADQLVPIANANAMANLMIAAGKDCQYIVYPGAQHTFDATAGPTANPQATADARQKSIVFLQTKLR